MTASPHRGLAAAAAWIVLAFPGGASAADLGHRWRGLAGDDAGHGVVSRGEAIWNDYLFDDYGANVDGFESMGPDPFLLVTGPHVYPSDPLRPGIAPSGHIGRFRHTGDYGYPPDQPYDPAGDPLGENQSYQNVADIAEMRLAMQGDQLFLRVSLTDLPRPDATVVGIAIDSDADVQTGGGDWPFGVQLASAGWERFLTIWGTGAALSEPGGKTQDLVRDLGGAISTDVAANTIDVRIPRAAIASPGRTRWRLIAGAGRWDPGASSWAVPDPTTTQSTSPGSMGIAPRVYDLAFNQDEPNSLSDDTAQANALAGRAVQPHGWEVDLRDLEAGRTVPVPCRPGPHEETFNSTLRFGAGPRREEGLIPLPQSAHNVNYGYLWHVQPLAIELPPSACDPESPAPGLDYFFHPANTNHNAWFVGVQGSAERRVYVKDPPSTFSRIDELARRYDRITATGMSMGEGWNYGDMPGEERADADAFRAVSSRYRHDPDRVRALGMSGRLGALFFAETWPDRISQLVTVSYHDADSPKLVNLRNTPYVFMHGTTGLEIGDEADYDVLSSHLNELGYQYLNMLWEGRGHDVNLLDRSYALVEPWASAPRIHPAHVTYRIDPADARPNVPLFPGVGFARRATLADPQKPALVDLTSLALAGRLPTRETRFKVVLTNVRSGDRLELSGLSYATEQQLRARMPDALDSDWVMDTRSFAVKPLAVPARRRALAGTLENISRLTIDLRAAGIRSMRRIDLSGVRTNVPVSVRLQLRGASRTLLLRP